jgi:hypothetical protein
MKYIIEKDIAIYRQRMQGNAIRGKKKDPLARFDSLLNMEIMDSVKLPDWLEYNALLKVIRRKKPEWEVVSRQTDDGGRRLWRIK